MLVDPPLASPFLQGTERDWAIEIEPQVRACQGMPCVKNPEHRGKTGCCRWPMGKGLGGGSTINYMVIARISAEPPVTLAPLRAMSELTRAPRAQAYVRGSPEDFNEWADMGAEGWN